MTKTELIQAVAQRLPKIHVNDVDRVINATLDTIKAEVTAGGEVNLIGFGKFSVKEISARIGMNPRTGEDIQLPARRRVYFKQSKTFKKALQS